MQLPEPRLWLVHEPDDAPESTRALYALHDLDGGVVVVRVTPGAHQMHVVAQDVLNALGKNHNHPGSMRAGKENWRRCAAWLSGERVRHLIVDRAETLQAHHWHEFIGLAAYCDMSLRLIVHGGSLARTQSEMLSDWPVAEITFEQFLAAHAAEFGGSERRDNAPSAGIIAAPAATFPAVPSSDFTTFRADCRLLLSSAAFERVEVEMQEAARITREWLEGKTEPNGTAIQGHLCDLIRDCRTTGHAIARLRAAQAVCLMAGLLVTVNLERLAASTRIARPLIDRQLVRQLREYSNTRRAAAALLACLTAASPEALSRLNMSDVTPDEVRVAGMSFEVPVVARNVLAAHLHTQLVAGAGPGDALFSDGYQGPLGDRLTPRAVRRAIDDVARASGLMLWDERRIRDDPSQDGWLRRRGVSVRDIR